MENLALLFFKSDTRTIETAYTLTTVPIDIGFAQAMIALPKLVAFGGALVASVVLILIVGRTDLGRAIRAVGGWLSDRYGARRGMYWVLGGCCTCCVLLAVPRMDVFAPGEGIMAVSAGRVDEVTPRGIVVAGSGMGTADESYLYCAAYGNGNFIVRGFGPAPFQMNGRRGGAAPPPRRGECGPWSGRRRPARARR